MAGSNCIGPSAPAPLAPEWTPGRFEVPFPDSTVPMAASTVQGSPGQVAAACLIQREHSRRDRACWLPH